MKDFDKALELTSQEFLAIIFKDLESPVVKQYLMQDAASESPFRRSERLKNESRPNADPEPIQILPKRFMNSLWLANHGYKHQISNMDFYEDLPYYTISQPVTIGEFGYMKDISYKVVDHSIIINRCIFSSTLQIRNLSSKYSISFSNCVFGEGVSIENINIESVQFLKGEFRKDVSIAQNCVINSLNIYNCQFKNVDIKYNQISSLVIDYSHFDNFKIIDIKSKKISIRVVSAKEFLIEEIETEKIYLNNKLSEHDKSEEPTIENLVFNFSEKADKMSAYIRQLKLNKLTIKGLLASKTTVFKNLKISHLSFSNFSNEGKINFQNIVLNPNSTLTIEESNLGKTEFNNLDATKANYFKIIKSVFSELSLISTILPLKIISDDTINTKNYGELRDAYRQLKQVYSKQGDKFNEMLATQKEFDVYFRSLRWKVNTSDKIVLFLNRLSNRYGLSVSWSFWSTVITSLILYTLYCFFLGYSIGNDYSLFKKIMSYFIEFINPIHKPDYIADSLNMKNTPIARIWEGVSRIILGYFIYQFIQAFRKFGK